MTLQPGFYMTFPWKTLLGALERLIFILTGNTPRGITPWRVPATLTREQRRLLRKEGVALSKRDNAHLLWIPENWERQSKHGEGWRIVDPNNAIWIQVSKSGKMHFQPT